MTSAATRIGILTVFLTLGYVAPVFAQPALVPKQAAVVFNSASGLLNAGQPLQSVPLWSRREVPEESHFGARTALPWMSSRHVSMPRSGLLAAGASGLSPLASGPKLEGIVVEVRESDLNADGITDDRVTITSEYDQRGNLVQSVTESDLGAEETIDARTTVTCTYDQRGNLVHQTLVGVFLTFVILETHTWAYDNHGNPVQESYEYHESHDQTSASFGFTITSEYDQRGKLLRQVTEDSVNGTIAQRTTATWQYDQRGNPLYAIFEGDDGADGTIGERRTLTWAYDQRGNPVQLVVAEDLGADGSIEGRFTVSWAYDQRGNLLHEILEGSAGWDRRSLEYDQYGNLVHELREVDDMADGTIDRRSTSTWAYDPRGDLLNRTYENDPDGDFSAPADSQTATFEYDQRGNLLRQVNEIDHRADGTVEDRGTDTRTYDQRGNLLQQVNETDNGADGTIDSRSTFSFEYERTQPR